MFSLLTDIYIAYIKEKTLNIRNFGYSTVDSLNTAHIILHCSLHARYMKKNYDGTKHNVGGEKIEGKKAIP